MVVTLVDVKASLMAATLAELKALLLVEKRVGNLELQSVVNLALKLADSWVAATVFLLAF